MFIGPKDRIKGTAIDRTVQNGLPPQTKWMLSTRCANRTLPARIRKIHRIKFFIRCVLSAFFNPAAVDYGYIRQSPAA